MSDEQGAELERLRAQLAATEDNLSQASLENDTLKARNSALEAENRRLNGQLRQVQGAMSHLQDLYLQACEAIDQLLDKISSLEDAVGVDHLTGLQNRRALDKTVEALQRRDERVVYIFMDLNNFKKVNDSQAKGHEFGDKLLKELAVAIVLAAMKHGIGPRRCYRWGGDEFVVICPSAEVALKVEGDIKRLFGRRHYFEAVVSVEAGVSDDITEADRLLIEYKRLGKSESFDHVPIAWPGT